ncbi:MAG: hypothetical protein ACI4E1_05845 [Lachnospira sp.]
MPDISLLVAVADFYDVDVREIIEGERKSEMNEELVDVANKMADYAGNEKSKIMKWIEAIGFAGVFILTVAIAFQCMSYDSSIFHKGALIATCISLVIMVIITLYVCGVLERIGRKKGIVIAVKVATISLAAISLSFIMDVLLVFVIGVADYSLPFKTEQGIEKYDKAKMVKEYSADFDSGFFIFPNSIDNAKTARYESKVKTGLFDSDGYFILEAEYDETDFENEISRLSDISCDISYNETSVTKQVVYDENMYEYPAYITSDGYDYIYEYALIDELNSRIIYVILSYPEYSKLQDYKEFLKKNADEYNLDNKTVLENFTIYAHKFPGIDGWIEYSDME